MTTAAQIHHQAVREDVSVIAASLQEQIGQRLAAYGAAIKDPKQIGRYASKSRSAAETTAARLREVYKVVQLLLTQETPETARAWLIGRNPQLEGDAPIELMHDQQYQRVMRAAEEFIADG